MDGKVIDPKYLADGKILLEFKKEFIKDRRTENLYPLLACLRDSVVILPTVPGENGKFLPDVIKTEKEDYVVPVFSQKEQIPEAYQKKFQLISAPMVSCIELAKSMDILSGMVLDPFTAGMVITFELAEVILKMESRLKPQ